MQIAKVARKQGIKFMYDKFFKVKAKNFGFKAKDMKTGLRGSSRPRKCPREPHYCRKLLKSKIALS